MKERESKRSEITEITHLFRSELPAFISTDVVNIHSGLSIAGE